MVNSQWHRSRRRVAVDAGVATSTQLSVFMNGQKIVQKAATSVQAALFATYPTRGIEVT